ncbi:MAG TPA: serine/threonine-protein kinase [Candidatus Dormibacteraeota bacterium]|nr:serine/threonine-protein kinase [Candidatus Dormibacteraeota bacterium]
MGQDAPHQNGQNGLRPNSGHGNGHRKVGGYRLVRELDTDSLGSVYEAEHPRLHRRVALRTIGTGVAREVSFSRRFLLELRSYTALEHEAIPKLYELAYDGESPYLVTELVPGVTFDTVLGDGQRYEPLGIIDLMRPIASALDYAHSRATVHRDVKPANILLADDGRTLLTGFGLGTVASFNTGPGATGPVAPDYVAPERLVGHDVDGRADVYSLAAVIFEATTGRRPFSSKSWIETLSRRLYEPPPNVREVAPELPAGFASVLQQAMDRDPARRPATAGELLLRLEAAIVSPDGQPDENGSGPRRRLRRLLRR